jgi:hypothetical protein
MKLSEAIRLGALLKPQGIATPSGSSKSCALLAACEAVGQLMTSAVLATEWPEMYGRAVSCPVCDAHHSYLTGCIGCCLNDKHRWTREQIADWVQTIEEQAVAKVGEAQAVEPVPVSVGEALAR